MLHTEPSFRIYFGDAQNQLYPADYLTWQDNLLVRPEFDCLAKFKLNTLFFLHQVHGVDGAIVSSQSCDRPFAQEGDFLITQESHLGIGVMTADCLPVVLYDKKNHAIGIAHAGWRGAIKGVVVAAVKKMQCAYNTQPDDLRFFLGPSAKKCCYQVDDQFGVNLEDYFFGSHYLHQKPTGLYFDLPGFVVQQLSELLAINPLSIGLSYNVCTICNPAFWSYRRGTKNGAPEKVGRQMTVVSLF